MGETMKQPAKEPAHTIRSSKEQRAIELASCERELSALLDRHDAALSGGVMMQLHPDGSPKYQFVINVVSR